MKQEFSKKNIKKYVASICKINAEKIEGDLNGQGLAIKREETYEIEKIKDKSFNLRFLCKVYIDPEALFCADLEYEVYYEFTHNVDKNFIDDNIDVLLRPLGNEVSYFTSTLSKMFTNVYFVTPPVIKTGKDNAKK